MPSDPYALLGVASNATDDEIKRAYRALARELHPDANPGNPEAEARFKEITVAYETLRDPERRRRFDMFGDDGRGGAGQGAGEAFGFGDLFDAFFSGSFGGGGSAGPPRAPDAEAIMELDLAQAAFGTMETLELQLPSSCDRCEGSGCEPGTHPSRCESCGGAGEVRQVRRSILGQLVTAVPCVACAGTGSRIPNPCTTCGGDGRVRSTRHIEVEVPAGIDDGQRLRLTGRGPAAPRNGVAGDLYVTVRVRPHPTLERHGYDLVHQRRIAMTQAALGTVLTVETLDEPEQVTVPPGTQPGHVFRFKGRGVPVLQGRGRGDLLVQIDVDVPQELTEAEHDLLSQFAELRGEEVAAPAEGGFFSRIRSTFGER
ncbi:MAG: molecular chaperone DnaJ [Acidimicrobiia bacterium]